MNLADYLNADSSGTNYGIEVTIKRTQSSEWSGFFTSIVLAIRVAMQVALCASVEDFWAI